jgi:hypothetical protein
LFAHDLFGKPLPTFPDHALAALSPVSSTCSAYQQAAGGSWMQLPCKEDGERSQTQTQHRPAARGTDHEER